MPDAAGHFKGQGWSRARETSWTRVFGLPTCNCGEKTWQYRRQIDEYSCRTCGYRVNGPVMARKMQSRDKPPEDT